MRSLARILPPPGDAGAPVAQKRSRKAPPVVIGQVACWNPHTAGALALAMRQGLTIRATYEAGTITLKVDG